jgi:hypothetical protein
MWAVCVDIGGNSLPTGEGPENPAHHERTADMLVIVNEWGDVLATADSVTAARTLQTDLQKKWKAVLTIAPIPHTAPHCTDDHSADQCASLRSTQEGR